MEIREVTENKRQYLPLLLLADEQESMIDRYLDRGRMFVLFDDANRAAAECVITDEGGGVCEIKNLAVLPEYQRRGLGKMLVQLLLTRYAGICAVMQVGTSPGNIPFYEACGFTRHRVVPGFFTAHYDHPIVENGEMLTDMIYLQRSVPE